MCNEGDTLKSIPKYIFIGLILVGNLYLHAAEKSYMVRYIMSYPTTIEKGLTAPLQWQTKDWLTAGAVVAGGAVLYLYDEDIDTWVQAHRSDLTHQVSKVGNVFGDGKYMFPAVAIIWLGGWVAGSEKTQDTGALMIKTMLIAGGTTAVLKYATQRNRPNTHGGNQFWLESHFSHYNDSFPSGHATIAFSMATILAEQYKETTWVPIIAYSGATLTCFARVHDQKHWTSDVFAGAVVGYFTGKLVIKTTPKLYIAPLADLNGVGFAYKF
jgi:membrane-associated phospholipid phosphatase